MNENKKNFYQTISERFFFHADKLDYVCDNIVTVGASNFNKHMYVEMPSDLSPESDAIGEEQVESKKKDEKKSVFFDLEF
ncbi:hypothetical protein A0J61_04350 [Choanephora cucurbitarum]|uniref:Uncharacterized protein n=1 Tax=Choanephora cucurbitarum TaxID=101091 RepID=A0A1C7NF71_9FUNG|nr:hypothetical protein A0J61_04350 [Choanephora cucurbitarum]